MKSERVKADPLTRLKGLFKKAHAEGEYPVDHEPYTGPVSGTGRRSEVERTPLDSHVTPYHTGHYTHSPHRDVEAVPSTVEMRTKQHAPEDYPQWVETYTGTPVPTTKAGELGALPLDTHVSIYHTGHYDVPAVAREEKPSAFALVTGLFKKRHEVEGYPPHEEHYQGHVWATERRDELDASPIDSHVAVYHSGRYDELKPLPVDPKKHVFEGYPPHTVAYHGPVHSTARSYDAEPGPLDSQVKVYHTGHYDHLPVMRKKTLHADYPASAEPYSGHLESIHRTAEVGPESLDSRVALYHSGHYTHLPVAVAEEQRPHEERTLTRLTSLFRKPSHHVDEAYPVHTEPYTGPLNTTHRVGEAGAVPLDSHVTVYHSGRSDEAVKHVETMERKMTHVPALQEAYTGPLETVHRQGELDGHPLDSHVATYHTGYYEHLPVVRKKTLPAGYPISAEPYHGHMESTHRVGELGAHPLESHVSVYHSGRSDEAMPAKMLEKKISHLPPVETYTGPLETVHRGEELAPSALDSHVTIYHTGHYEHLPVQRKKTVPAGYPILAEPYQGQLDEIHRISEVDPEPLETRVSAYHTGHYDQLPAARKLTQLTPYPVSAAPYTGHVDSIHRSAEVGLEPLDSHVSVYHSGVYDHPPPPTHAEAKSGEKQDPLSAITGFFRRLHEHGYPVDTEPYTGGVMPTELDREMEAAPLDTRVTVYHSGRSDEHVGVRPKGGTTGYLNLQIWTQAKHFSIAWSSLHGSTGDDCQERRIGRTSSGYTRCSLPLRLL